jgi:NTP pyrophosphatase (non-canonical NTP hydrolase)
VTFAEYAAARVSTDGSMGVAERHGSLVYPALGLAGETGEVVDKIKKVIRDRGGVLRSDDVEAIEKELGDVLWYLDACAAAIGSNLERVAGVNIAKLQLRKQRGTLQGSGDNR